VNGAAGARAPLPIDDAAYLELTLRVDAPLATLDRELAARFEGVRLVGA
jgi:predicted nucleic acid-binding protein